MTLYNDLHAECTINTIFFKYMYMYASVYVCLCVYVCVYVVFMHSTILMYMIYVIYLNIDNNNNKE